MPKKLTEQDFINRYTVEPMYAMTEESCWTWTGAIRTNDGYGKFQDRLAHIKNYEKARGKVPAGLELDHLCRVRSCINPAHLEAVSHAENVRRGIWGTHQKAKTHCPRGHEYNAANTYKYKGRRCCRACNNIISLEKYYKRKGR
jgi:hypothetical protein